MEEKHSLLSAEGEDDASGTDAARDAVGGGQQQQTTPLASETQCSSSSDRDHLLSLHSSVKAHCSSSSSSSEGPPQTSSSNHLERPVDMPLGKFVEQEAAKAAKANPTKFKIQFSRNVKLPISVNLSFATERLAYAPGAHVVHRRHRKRKTPTRASSNGGGRLSSLPTRSKPPLSSRRPPATLPHRSASPTLVTSEASAAAAGAAATPRRGGSSPSSPMHSRSASLTNIDVSKLDGVDKKKPRQRSPASLPRSTSVVQKRHQVLARDAQSVFSRSPSPAEPSTSSTSGSSSRNLLGLVSRKISPKSQPRPKRSRKRPDTFGHSSRNGGSKRSTPKSKSSASSSNLMKATRNTSPVIRAATHRALGALLEDDMFRTPRKSAESGLKPPRAHRRRSSTTDLREDEQPASDVTAAESNGGSTDTGALVDDLVRTLSDFSISYPFAHRASAIHEQQQQQQQQRPQQKQQKEQQPPMLAATAATSSGARSGARGILNRLKRSQTSSSTQSHSQSMMNLNSGGGGGDKSRSPFAVEMANGERGGKGGRTRRGSYSFSTSQTSNDPQKESSGSFKRTTRADTVASASSAHSRTSNSFDPFKTALINGVLRIFHERDARDHLLLQRCCIRVLDRRNNLNEKSDYNDYDLEPIIDLCVVDVSKEKIPKGFEALTFRNSHTPAHVFQTSDTKRKLVICFKRRKVPAKSVAEAPPKASDLKDPITDVQVKFSSSKSIPPGYEAITTTYHGAPLLEKKSSFSFFGDSEVADEPTCMYLLISRTPSYSMIKNLGLVRPDTNDEPPAGFVRLKRTPRGKVANLNYEAPNDVPSVFLCLEKDCSSYLMNKSEITPRPELKYISPLLLACHVQEPSLAVIAVNVLEPLIVNGFLDCGPDHRDLEKAVLRTIVRALADATCTFSTTFHKRLSKLFLTILKSHARVVDSDMLFDVLLANMRIIDSYSKKRFLRNCLNLFLERHAAAGASSSSTSHSHSHSRSSTSHRRSSHHTSHHHRDRDRDRSSRHNHRDRPPLSPQKKKNSHSYSHSHNRKRSSGESGSGARAHRAHDAADSGGGADDSSMKTPTSDRRRLSARKSNHSVGGGDGGESTDSEQGDAGFSLTIEGRGGSGSGGASSSPADKGGSPRGKNGCIDFETRYKPPESDHETPHMRSVLSPFMSPAMSPALSPTHSDLDSPRPTLQAPKPHRHGSLGKRSSRRKPSKGGREQKTSTPPPPTESTPPIDSHAFHLAPSGASSRAVSPIPSPSSTRTATPNDTPRLSHPSQHALPDLPLSSPDVELVMAGAETVTPRPSVSSSAMAKAIRAREKIQSFCRGIVKRISRNVQTSRIAQDIQVDFRTESLFSEQFRKSLMRFLWSSFGDDERHKKTATLILVLCKLGLGPLPGEAYRSFGSESFELLHYFIRKLSSSKYRHFRAHEDMTFLLRRFVSIALTISLGHHSSSRSSRKTFTNSLSVFTTLWRKFPDQFKLELVVILHNSLLPLLANDCVPIERRAAILDTLQEIPSPQVMANIYYNYDNNNSSIAVFQRIVEVLSQICVETKPEETDSGKNLIGIQSSQSLYLHVKSLSAICMIVNCLYKWNKKINASDSSRHHSRSASRAATTRPTSSSPTRPKGKSVSLKLPEKHSSDRERAKSSTLGLDVAKKKTRHQRSRTVAHRFAVQSTQKKLIEDAVALANEGEATGKKLRKALKFLVTNGVVGDTPEASARFVHLHNEQLSIEEVGMYLGGTRPKEEMPFEEDVRLAFLEGIHFQDPFLKLRLDRAMRILLTDSGFRLPGDSNPLSRILESFADVYFKISDENFETEDAVYVMAYAVLMLNTSLHNDNMKEGDRMKLDVFLSTCHNIPGVPYDDDECTDIYNTIKKDGFEIKFATPDANPRKESEDHSHSSSTRSLMRKTSGAGSGRGRSGSVINDDRPANLTRRNSQAYIAMSHTVALEQDEEMTIEFIRLCNRLARNTLGELTREAERFRNIYGTASEDISKAMFSCAYAPLTRAIQNAIQCKDTTRVSKCLESFYYLLKLSITLKQKRERTTIAQAFAEFTFLHYELQQRNEEQRTSIIERFPKGSIAPVRIPQPILNEGLHLDQTWITELSVLPTSRIAEATSLIEYVIREVRTTFGTSTNETILTAIQNTIADNVNIMSPSRTYVGEGDLDKLSADGAKKAYRVFVFNDSILCCTGAPPKYKVQRVIQLAFAEVYDLSERFAFRVSNPQRNTTFFASSENGKKEWMRTIHRSIQSSLDQRKEVISATQSLIAKSEISSAHYQDLLLRMKTTSLFMGLTKEMVDDDNFDKDGQDRCKLCWRAFTKFYSRRTCAVCTDTNLCRNCCKSKVEGHSMLKISKGKMCDVCAGMIWTDSSEYRPPT